MSTQQRPLILESAACCLCGGTAGMPVGVGEDFEYRTSPDTFLAIRCPKCTLVYLDPRPSMSELETIYPDNYHAFNFGPDAFGVVHKVRERLEARRMLRLTAHLSNDAVILDVGCGDGFHLDIIRRHGTKRWQLIGVDTDKRAVDRARQRGLRVFHGCLEDAPIKRNSVDLALCVQTIEHVENPVELLREIGRVVRPGGGILIVTDNTSSPDFRFFKARHWGGYHFPRHWNLFNRRSIIALADLVGLKIESFQTMASPVNWTYSIRNWLDDWGASPSLVSRFTLRSPVALGVFALLDGLLRLLGRGALLRVVMRVP